MVGEKMKCKVILPKHERRSDITEYYFYQTLSIYHSGRELCKKVIIHKWRPDLEWDLDLDLETMLDKDPVKVVTEQDLKLIKDQTTTTIGTDLFKC